MTTPKLMSASKDDDVETVTQLLALGLSPDSVNGIGQTSLHVAAIWGNLAVARVLLDAGASVNVVNQFGATPLHFAAQNKRVEMAKLLLKRGADTQAQGGTNGSRPYEMAEGELRALLGGPSNAMHRAVKSNDLDGLLALLVKGVDVMELDGSGRTPMHLAALAAVAESEAGAKAGMNALTMLLEAARSGGDGVATAACGVLDSGGLSPLHVLVGAGHMPGTALLLKSGASPNGASHAQDDVYRSGQWARQTADGSEALATEDRTALHVALEATPPLAAMVALLLAHGADPNARDLERFTPLHMALGTEELEPQLDLAEALLQHKADPSLGNNECGATNSCLHTAAGRNDVAAVQLLLRHGAAHSTAGKGGFTPLATAARAGALKVIPLLLEAGADPDAPTASGKSARELAVINKKTAVVELFDAR